MQAAISSAVADDLMAIKAHIKALYCIVTIVGGYGWKFETQLGTI